MSQACTPALPSASSFSLLTQKSSHSAGAGLLARALCDEPDQGERKKARIVLEEGSQVLWVYVPTISCAQPGKSEQSPPNKQHAAQLAAPPFRLWVPRFDRQSPREGQATFPISNPYMRIHPCANHSHSHSHSPVPHPLHAPPLIESTTTSDAAVLREASTIMATAH
eukprot:1158487-Pelagomonas_calceolata.AAC.6